MVMMKEYHVALTGNDRNDGSVTQPFRTISKAASVAEAGSKIIVHEGEYREWVKPAHRGLSEVNRVVYEAAEGEKVVIKGSEIVSDWKVEKGTIWKTIISNALFGDYNPYGEVIKGDWFVSPEKWDVHTGEVYLNGKALYEAKSLEALSAPKIRYKGCAWTNNETLLYPEDSIYQWYAVVTEEYTIIYANFHEYNPNQELVEINVRKCCFYPEFPGMDFITVRGFEMAHAACPFTPPTADQPGLLGTNWSKGWIIENNIIHDAKCSGISIGKNKLIGGDNLSSKRHRKSAHQYQLEAVFQAKIKGWNKETIGSHIIRNNVIFDCGQNGIVGHLGCIFSEIYGNEIYNIAVKQEFFGFEIAGIKLHTAIDVQIHNNYIHHCSLGTWLDWQAQGTRVSRNLYESNYKDVMIEVTHGPYMIDNNIFASKFNFNNVAQGGAFIHNLCLGGTTRVKVMDRTTPYHYPHTTDVAGYAIVYGADDRYYQNLFVGGAVPYTEKTFFGTEGYQDAPASLEEYIEKVMEKGGKFDEETVVLVEQPAYIDGNAYLGLEKSYDREENFYRTKEKTEVVVIREDSGIYLEIMIPEEMLNIKTKLIDTENLPAPRIVDALYEKPDGSALIFDKDYHGNQRANTPTVGPFENLHPGFNRIKVW